MNEEEVCCMFRVFMGISIGCDTGVANCCWNEWVWCIAEVSIITVWSAECLGGVAPEWEDAATTLCPNACAPRAAVGSGIICNSFIKIYILIQLNLLVEKPVMLLLHWRSMRLSGTLWRRRHWLLLMWLWLM